MWREGEDTMQHNLHKLTKAIAVLGFLQLLLNVLVNIIATARSNIKIEQGTLQGHTSPRLSCVCNLTSTMRKFVADSTTNLRSILAIVGVLSAAMLLNIVTSNNALSQVKHRFEFREPNLTSGEISVGPGGIKKDLLIHAGLYNRYEPIKFYRWHNKFQGCAEVIIDEIIDGVKTPHPSDPGNIPFTYWVTNNDIPLALSFAYINVELGNIAKIETWESDGGVGDAESQGFGTIRPSRKLNNIRNQNVEYKFYAYRKDGDQAGGCPRPTLTTPTDAGAVTASIKISRKHVNISWQVGDDNNDGESDITSGVYRPGSSEYPVTYAHAWTSLYTEPFNGHTYVIRASEHLNGRPVTLMRDAVRDDQAGYSFIGRNLFKYGDWVIDDQDWVPNDNTRCHASNFDTYINCFRIAYRPNKQAIDNLYGTVTIKLEIAHIRGDDEFSARTLTLTINGRPTAVPQVSMVMDAETENGVTEGEDQESKINLYFTSPPTENITLQFNVTQTGNFINATSITKTVNSGAESAFLTVNPNSSKIPEDNMVAGKGFVIIDDDGNVEEDGNITISIAQPTIPTTSGWTKTLVTAEQSVTFSVHDNDIPIVSVVPHSDSFPQIYELPNQDAKFVIRAHNAPITPLEVFINVRQLIWDSDTSMLVGVSNLLDPSFSIPRSVTIDAGETETILNLRTLFDPNDSTNRGAIEVALLAPPPQPSWNIFNHKLILATRCRC